MFYPSAGEAAAELRIEIEAKATSTQTIVFAIHTDAKPIRFILNGLLPFSLEP